MRWPSFQATLTAAIVLLVPGSTVHAQSDAFFAEADVPETKPSLPLVQVPGPRKPPALQQPVDLKKADASPTGSLTSRKGEPPVDPLAMDTLLDKAEPFKAKPDARVADPKAKPADKTLDPEPDVAIKPVAPTAKDPLDALTEPVAKPGAQESSKKADLPKADATKTNAKTDMPKGDTKAPSAADALSPVATAIKAALDKRGAVEIRGAFAAERRKEREAIAFLYAAHGFGPIWSDAGAPVAAVSSVLERLARAGDDALTIAAPPASLKTTGTPEVLAESDVALTESVVAYARQATGSRLDPMSISPLIGAKRQLADAAEVVDSVAAAGTGAGDKLQALNPTDARYVALREKLVDLHGAPETTPAGALLVTAGPVLKVGMKDARVPSIRTRLGIGLSEAGPDDKVYDTEVSAAVADFQEQNGLPASGVLTKRTVEAMGGKRTVKVVAPIVANMEMWRWMPRDLGADRIEVNVPDFTVTVFHDNAAMSHNRVVVGKIDTPTPLFSNTMKYLIVNPYWNVPQSIIRNEMLPKGGGSLSYLNGHGYSVSSHDGMPVVRQLPGEKNALGRIKFLFPNDYSVYLHDTPSKALFSSVKRAYSHGCVRVDKPFAFAESVLNDTSGDRKVWSQERLEDMIGDKERYVNLPTPLPIHIEYFTASVEADGKVKLRDDVYGYANAVAAALGQDNQPLPIAGRVKPAPVVVADRTRRQPVATAAAVPAPAASRSFWDVFDPR